MKDSSNTTKKIYSFPNDRRKFKRALLETDASYMVVNGKTVTARVEITNITSVGIGFRCKEYLNQNDVVELYIDIPGHISIIVTVRVLWMGMMDETLIYGGEFIALSNLSKSIIEDYMKHVKK